MSKLSATARAVLVVAIVASVTGCGWFHRSSKLYAGPPESRPLEVPPELDASALSSGNTASSTTASAAQQVATQASSLGFTAQGTRDDVFAKVGTALAAVPGVTIANRAPLIGAYDVSYAGSNFLVRVSAGEGGSVYVAAVDPRGLPATGDAARRLVAALKTAVAP